MEIKAKKASAIIGVLLLLALIIIAVLYFCGYLTPTKTFNFHNSAKVTVSDMDGNNLVELTGDDKSFVEKFCSAKNAVSEEYEIPACFFDTVIITIKKGGKTYIINPSVDSCNNLAIEYMGVRYYGSMADSIDTFKSILAKNGVPWYW